MCVFCQENKSKDNEITKLKEELAVLRVTAKASAGAAEKLVQLEKDVKKLTEENKTLTENFNSERVNIIHFFRFRVR